MSGLHTECVGCGIDLHCPGFMLCTACASKSTVKELMNPPKDLLRLELADGQYTIVQDAEGRTCVLRQGEPWIETLATMPGGKMTLGMAYEIERLRGELDLYTDTISKLMDEVSSLRAAQRAYASEFDGAGEYGDPDVGSIHQNIRGLKKTLDSYMAQLDARKGS